MNENLQAVEVPGFAPYFKPVIVFGYSAEEVERYEQIENFLIRNEEMKNVELKII